MDPLSSKLLGFEGRNPFRDSQAKTYGEEKVVAEFHPTSLFWSLFNDQHEILLGTRGSGKTILLRMLTYSCIRRCELDDAKAIAKAKSYLGFYIPLHLEFVSCLPGEGHPEAERLLSFQLAFNCVAAKALLAQIPCLLEDIESDPRKRLEREAVIVDHIAPLWFPDGSSAAGISGLRDLEWQIDLLFGRMDRMTPSELRDLGQFSKRLMSPVQNVLQRLTLDLGLDPQHTRWVACIDEAEFLDQAFQKCINTFMRSEKRPLVLKMATLPFRHVTRETLVPEVSIEPNGNDFNYRVIDTPWESEDFGRLCDHICRVRLSKCGLPGEGMSLESFLGKPVHGDDLIDYFRAELPDESSDKAILEGIQGAVSGRRREHIGRLPLSKGALEKPYLDRFAPVYFMRRMRTEDAKGARSVGWFAGPKMIRRIADGNPRRFIQIMNSLVERATKVPLTARAQHRVVRAFCKSLSDECEALPRYGLVLYQLLKQIGGLLEERVHGDRMVDGGCGFTLHEDLADDEMLVGAIRLAVDYLHVRVDDASLLSGRISDNSEFRLCLAYGVVYWLPMRTGEALVLRNRSRLLVKAPIPVTRREAQGTMRQFQLELIDENPQ